MTLVEITALFKWMAIINLALFLLSFMITVLFKAQVLKIHAKLFNLPEIRVQEMLYGLFGVYKISIIIFSFVPYIALLVIQ